MNNLLSVLERTSLKLIGKKLKLCKIHVMPAHIFFRIVFNIIWYFFSTKKIKIKAKDLQSPWITNGIKKSSKCKQRLYNKFLKNRSEKIETKYKNYKNLFEAIKKRSKKNHFSKLILIFKKNITKLGKLLKIQLAKVNVTIRVFLNRLLLII